MRSPFEQVRAGYAPRIPDLLRAAASLSWEEEPATAAAAAIRERFPRTCEQPPLRLVAGAAPPPRPVTCGVVLSGGQAPGGHNVLAALLDGLLAAHPGSRLLGFLGGPAGILARRTVELDAPCVEPYRNTGGFDLLGSGRDKIESAEQLAACRETCVALGLDGLVIVGGDDSNTNAAVLAEHLLEHGARTAVVGVPKTIDGDLKGDGIEASFGFDTATRVYSELIGNICRDAKSAGKYWHFIRLMGRSASHVTLECALRTRPNVTLIGEEAAASRTTLAELFAQIADTVRRRAAAGRRYGVLLLPEGLVEFLPEMRVLIAELNVRQAAELSPACRATFDALPERIRAQLQLDRDAHGNVTVSQIDTEQLLVHGVSELVGKLQVQGHFFGYEGRCAAPSDFDADYTATLGRLAAALVCAGRTGYLCSVRDLVAPPARWQPRAVPLTALMQLETRKGRPTPVIRKALVRLDGQPFRSFAAARERWAVEDAYLYPGALQYFGPDEVRGGTTETLRLESAQ